MTVPKALTAEEALIQREQQALNALAGTDHTYFAEPWSRRLDAIENDVAYLENVVNWRAFKLGDEAFGGPYVYLKDKPTGFLSRKGTRTSETVTPIAGLYDKVALYDAIIKGRGKPSAIAKALDETRLKDDAELLVIGSCSASRFTDILEESSVKAVTRHLVVVGPDGKAHLTDPIKTRFHNTHSGIVLTSKGQFKRVFTSEEAKRWAYASTKQIQGMYIAQTPVASQGVEMWDSAPAILAQFRERLAKFPPGGIHSVVPVLLRCYGDGDHQRHILRHLPYAHIFSKAALHTSDKLLHSAFCWRVHYTLDGADLPGMAYCYEDGRFIISDWCFRETPDGKAEWEQFSGRDNKLDVLTWLIGPGADKFGGETHKFKRAFGRPKAEAFKGLYQAFVKSVKEHPHALGVKEAVKETQQMEGKYVGLYDGSTLFIYKRDGLIAYKDFHEKPTHFQGSLYGYINGAGWTPYNTSYYLAASEVSLAPHMLCEMLRKAAPQADGDDYDGEE